MYTDSLSLGVSILVIRRKNVGATFSHNFCWNCFFRSSLENYFGIVLSKIFERGIRLSSENRFK